MPPAAAAGRPLPWRGIVLAGLLGLAAVGPAAAAGIGAPVGPPAGVATNAGTDAGSDSFARAATDGLGRWMVVWNGGGPLTGSGTDLDIFAARSIDNRLTWQPVFVLNSNAFADVRRDTNPQLAADGAGNWVVVWSSDDPNVGGKGSDFDILAARSSNHGQTWSPAQVVNGSAVGDLGGDFDPQVATDGLGNWIVVWSSFDSVGGTGFDPDILMARSTNNGATWTYPQPVNSLATTDARTDQEPMVVAGDSGRWVAVWASHETLPGGTGTDLDIHVASTDDAGATWTAQQALHPHFLTDTGADSEPRLATDGAGSWVAVWTSTDSLGGTIGTDAEVLFARSGDDASTWSSPAAVHVNGAADAAPDVAHGGLGWVVAWSSADTLGGTIGSDTDIVGTASTDGGFTFSAPMALNTNAAADGTSLDEAPSLATDGSAWLVAWHGDTTLGGTLGSDLDILVATFGCGDLDGDGAGVPANAACPTSPSAADCDDAQPAIFPGAPEVCDGLNNNCLHPSWPALAGTGEADGDGDGLSACNGDCTDASAAAWGPPGEATGVTVTGQLGTAPYIFAPPVQAGGTALSFDVLRSSVFSNFVLDTVCVETNDGSDLSFSDPAVPPSPAEFGSFFYYLVRARNGCPGAAGLGPLGMTSYMVPRVGRSCP